MDGISKLNVNNKFHFTLCDSSEIYSSHEHSACMLIMSRLKMVGWLDAERRKTKKNIYVISMYSCSFAFHQPSSYRHIFFSSSPTSHNSFVHTHVYAFQSMRIEKVYNNNGKDEMKSVTYLRVDTSTA